MRHIYLILFVLICVSVCNSQTSPNQPPWATPVNIPPTQTPLPQNQPPMPSQTQATLPIAPPSLDMNDAIRIARAEMERDVYKQALEAYQRSFDTAKWAIGIIFALFAYIIFRNTREY